MGERQQLEQMDTDELFARLRADGERAVRNVLVERHRGLARRLALRYRDRGEPFEDLEQVGLMALIGAIERFRPAQGAFAAYARVCITGELRRHFRDKTWTVFVPRSAKDLEQRMGPAQEALSHELGRPPKPAELAAQLSVGVDALLLAMQAREAYKTGSLSVLAAEVPAADGDGSERMTETAMVRTAVAELAEQDQQILALRFAEDLSQRMIAARVGMSQVQVSRRLRQICAQLRRAFEDDDLTPALSH